MPEFAYEATNDKNEPISGRLEAKNVFQAIADIEAQGLHITSLQLIEAGGSQINNETRTTNSRSYTTQEGSLLNKRLTAMIADRERIVPALTALAEELPRGRTRSKLLKLVAKLQAGDSAEQLRGATDLAAYWLPLLNSNVGGHQQWNSLLEDSYQESENWGQRLRALTYPMLVVLMALAVFLFLSVVVVPTFRDIFDDFELDLPQLTIWTLNISNMVTSHPIIVPLGLVAGCVLVWVICRWLLSTRLLVRVWDGLTAGSSRHVTTMAQFTRRLSSALAVGLSVPAALRLAGQSESNRETRRVALALAEEADRGIGDLTLSRWARRLPATVIHALQAGPEQQPSIPLLQQLSDHYSERVRSRWDWSTGFIAQFAILGIGIAVGVVVLSLLMPLVDLINGLTG